MPSRNPLGRRSCWRRARQTFPAWAGEEGGAGGPLGVRQGDARQTTRQGRRGRDRGETNAERNQGERER
eukprot:5235648-Pyramimonas_sp.AAC.1